MAFDVELRDGSSFGISLSGVAAQALTAALFTNSNSLAYAHTLTPGAVTLTQSSTFTNSNSLAFAHTLTPGTVTLTASLFSNSNALAYVHALTLNLTADLFANTNSLAYSHTLTPGTVTLTQSSTFGNSSSLAYAHTLAPGTVTLTQTSRFDDADSLAYAHTLTQVLHLAPSLFSNSGAFYTHALLNEFPDPSEVAAGVVYGPGGSLVGTKIDTGSSVHAWDSPFVHEQLFPPRQKRKRRPAVVRWH